MRGDLPGSARAAVVAVVGVLATVAAHAGLTGTVPSARGLCLVGAAALLVGALTTARTATRGSRAPVAVPLLATQALGQAVLAVTAAEPARTCLPTVGRAADTLLHLVAGRPPGEGCVTPTVFGQAAGPTLLAVTALALLGWHLLATAVGTLTVVAVDLLVASLAALAVLAAPHLPPAPVPVVGRPRRRPLAVPLPAEPLERLCGPAPRRGPPDVA